jgi:hypothetical protein
MKLLKKKEGDKKIYTPDNFFFALVTDFNTGVLYL